MGSRAWTSVRSKRVMRPVRASSGSIGGADEGDDVVQVLERPQEPSRMWARASARSSR